MANAHFYSRTFVVGQFRFLRSCLRSLDTEVEAMPTSLYPMCLRVDRV
jgi:hypothetical protein